MFGYYKYYVVFFHSDPLKTGKNNFFCTQSIYDVKYQQKGEHGMKFVWRHSTSPIMVKIGNAILVQMSQLAYVLLLASQGNPLPA